jgi:predicted dehydrogenase
VLEEAYGHSPLKKMFEQSDVYGVGHDADRAARKPLRLAVIGAGGVAQSKHIPAVMRLRTIWEPVELTAVASLDERSGRRLEQSYGCRWHADWRRMLKDHQLDGVIVSGPSEMHAEHASACLEAGLPVLVEKPITRKLADAKNLCALADQRGVVLMTVANKRFSPPYRRALRLVCETPDLQPRMFCGKFNFGYDYVPDLLQDGTIHLFDLARSFMGDVKTVWAQASGAGTSNSFRHAVITLRFSSGAVGSLHTTSAALSLKPWERVEVYGTKAWLCVEDQLELTVYDSEEGPAKSWRPVVPNTLLFDEEFGGYMGQIEHFLQVIRGLEKPLVTGWDGYRALELCEAAKAAIASGQGVELPL